MDTIQNQRSIDIYKHFFLFSFKTGLLLVLLLSACSPVVVPPVPAPVQNPAEIPNRSTEGAATGTTEDSPSPTPEADLVYPYYRPLTFKPEVKPQTINGVTVVIDWAYADESRIALGYTVSGLDWTDGSSLDPTNQVQMTSEAVPDLWMGGSGASIGLLKDGLVTGEMDQRLMAGALDAQKNPSIRVNVKIPVEGPTNVGIFHFKLDLPVRPGRKIENVNQVVVSNHVSMTLKEIYLSPSHADALICFQMPSAVDWGLSASTITVGDREYPWSGGGLVPGTDGKNFRLTDSERCGTASFDLAYESSITSLTLTIPRLMGSVPEVVDQERVDRANRRLADAGIEFQYVTMDHGANIEVLKRPEGKPDEEIYPMIWDALADQYEGPWIFQVPIKE